MSGVGALSVGRRALEEVTLSHTFFEDWFAGRVNGSALAARLEAFSPDFIRIAPDGRTVAFADLRDFLSERRSEESGAVFSIHIAEGAVVWETVEVALVSYVEEQSSHGVFSRRRSTALFVAAPNAPLGVQWRHLQETMIDPPQPGGNRPRPNP